MSERYEQQVYLAQAERVAASLQAAGVVYEVQSDFRITTFTVALADKAALDRAIVEVGDDD